MQVQIKKISEELKMAKTKRKLNVYQRFMKSCLRKAKSKRGTQKQKFKSCVREYRKKK